MVTNYTSFKFTMPHEWHVLMDALITKGYFTTKSDAMRSLFRQGYRRIRTHDLPILPLTTWVVDPNLHHTSVNLSPRDFAKLKKLDKHSRRYALLNCFYVALRQYRLIDQDGLPQTEKN